MVVLKYIAPDLAETTTFGASSDQRGLGRRGAKGAGREEGYIAAALASIDRRLIFCSDCQDAYVHSSQAFELDSTNSSSANQSLIGQFDCYLKVFSAPRRRNRFARPTQLVDRNARFVHGPVDHQRNVFGPGGAEGRSTHCL